MKQLTNRGYQNYLKAYKSKVRSMLKRDLFPASTKPLSRVAWEETYKATRNTLAGDVLAGTRKTVGNVNQYIISRQVYAVSAKQARSIKYAAEQAGMNLSLSEIRAGEFDWDIIKRDYYLNKSYGMTGAQAALDIAQFYFGSL